MHGLSAHLSRGTGATPCSRIPSLPGRTSLRCRSHRVCSRWARCQMDGCRSTIYHRPLFCWAGVLVHGLGFRAACALSNSLAVLTSPITRRCPQKSQHHFESLPICPIFLEGIGLSCVVSWCVCRYPWGYVCTAHISDVVPRPDVADV